MEELFGASFVNVAAMVVLAIAMVTVLSMCVCKTGESRDADIEEIEPSQKGLKKKQERVSVKQKANEIVADTDVVIDTVASAQEGETGAEKPANGRPLSHDRALPELPMATGRLPVDDDIEEDGHYNVVAKRPVVKPVTTTTAVPPSRIYNEVGGGANVTEISEENTDYAEVNDRGDDTVCDPTYAGIPEPRTVEKSDTTGGVVLRTVRHPYVAVDISGIGNLAFTDFADNEDADINEGVCRSQSMTTLESTVSVPAPPVPDKNFSDGGEASLVTPSGGNKSNSPSLPPRNGTDSVVGGGGLVDEDNSGEASSAVATSPTGKKKEPPYSRVTAREPLENLLRRQAEQSLLGDSFDPNYASVDYDQMKPPAFSSVATQSSDRNSLSSGFYAEIPSAGDSSSLTYAKVGGVELRNHAPTPPPLDTLKHLHLPQASVEEEVPDPGYSSIRNKSRSRGTAARNSETPISATASAATCQSPLYAVVNKRRTVHSDTDLESHPSDLYAQVNKPKKNRNHDNTNGARPKTRGRPAVTYGSLPNTTATRSGITDAKRAFFSNPGYQTIMDPLALGAPSSGRLRTSSYEPPYNDIVNSRVVDLMSSFDPNYDSIKRSKSDSDAMVANPDYESVNDDGDKRNVRKGRVSTVDPNYESVDLVFDDSKIKVTLVDSHHEPNYEVVPLAVETEEAAVVIDPPTIDLHPGGSTAAVQNGASEQWERREPIYQEINEEKRQKEGRKKKKKGKASK